MVSIDQIKPLNPVPPVRPARRDEATRRRKPEEPQDERGGEKPGDARPDEDDEHRSEIDEYV